VKEKFVAFLRGINVGGHHKVPMSELKKELQKLGFENVVTLLNSGNIIFEAAGESILNLEEKTSEHLGKSFGFPVPTIIRRSEVIHELLSNNPFKDIVVTKDIRLYVSLLNKDSESGLELPWTCADSSYRIIEKRGKTVLSILDLSISNTPKAMEAFERYFGKDVTTRNWNTIERIGKILF
jgi:uncharacterized protein (DUF1697 family)